MSEPQAKKIMQMPSGISVQANSNGSEPSICSGCGWADCRYFTAKKKISKKISRVKNADTAISKK